MDEIEKICSHVIVLKEGNAIYSGSVDGMTNSKGYFELKADNNDLLLKVLEELNLFSNLKQNGEVIIANIHEDLSASELNRKITEKGIYLSHLAKKKQSLEAQFLELVKNNPMKRLIAIEYYKNLTYRPFKIFTTLYFITLIALLFIGLIDIKFSEGFEINLKDQGIYNFPEIWNFTTWIVALLKIFLALLLFFHLSGIYKPDV